MTRDEVWGGGMGSFKPKKLERRHLEEAVSAILTRPLVMVTAPMGYGKTTLVRSFFHQHPEVRTVWLSFGRVEADEACAWRKLCENVKDLQPEIYEALTELGLPCDEQATGIFFSIVRKRITRPFCIVLDDYHECNGAAVNRLIERVAYEEIPNLHILIISRMYPDISYEEMFLKGYCGLLDQETLSLSREESRQIFEINGISLPEGELQRMYEYTDGWIAAVYLVLYDYMRLGHFEHLTNITRLLKTAMFDKIPERMRELCMKMSPFERFTLKEASYVLEKEVTFYEVLQMQEQFGFIQYDVTWDTYIMHTLLRTVASAELDRQGIDRKRLYERFGEFKEQSGDCIEALIYYQNAGAEEKMLRLLSGEMRNTIFEKAPGVVAKAFASVPLEKKMQFPVAYLSYIYYLLVKENAERGKELFLEFRENYRESAGEEGEINVGGELLIIESLLCFNDLERTNAKLGEAWEKLGHQPSGIFGDSLLTYGTPMMTVMYYRKSGELKRTIEQEKEYAKYYMRLMKGMDSGWDSFLDAEYALMIGDFDRADALAREVLERAAFRGSVCISISCYCIRLRCLIYKGREAEFGQVMEELRKQMKGIVRPVLSMDYDLICGYVNACIGRYVDIPEWLRSFQLEDCSRVVRNVRNGCEVYGLCLCMLHKWTLLDAVAEEILAPYESTCHVYNQICGYIFKAVAAFHLFGEEEAQRYLLTAAELAEPDGLNIPFIERGPEILPIIEGMDGSSAFLSALMPDISRYRQSLGVFKRDEQKTILTGREEELMSLVREGLRNSQIGQKMNIALVTVEKNLTSIYRKLNVTNRAAAVARMEEMGLFGLRG